MPPAAKSTKEEIVLAGERLIADHGVDGVSMRQIGAAIGSGNNSAVLYHFGSKEKLVEAIFEYRLRAYTNAAPNSLPDDVHRTCAAGWSARSSSSSSRASSATAATCASSTSISQHGGRRSSTCLGGSREVSKNTRSNYAPASAMSTNRCARTDSGRPWR